jgi:TetR/AcrR family transcriptional regulator
VSRPRTDPSAHVPTRRAGRPTASTDIPSDGEILVRGLAAFAELGYEGASVRELARRLGVSHNFINDRYGSKEQFWLAVVDGSLAGQVERLHAALGADDGDDLARLRNLVHVFHQADVFDPGLRRILQYESIRGGPRLDYVFEHYLAPLRAAVAPLVERLVKEGRVRPIPLDVMVYAVVALNAVRAETPFVALLGDTFATDPKGFASMLSDILLDGLLTQSRYAGT